MPSALERIIAWAGTLPDWQSDAVRRLLTQQSLTDADKVELMGMLKAKCGLVDSARPAPEPRPLKNGDLSGAPSSPGTVTLKAMEGLVNVNAISDGTKLPFGHKGLTVIYGDNATGKSGFARVLKRACRARDTNERILPNVYRSGQSGGARASFKLSVNEGPVQIVTWEDGNPGPELLANICVFDSKCARIILDESNRPIYLPYGAHVFQQLAEVLVDIKNKLEAEKPKPEPLDYPDIPGDTGAGRFLAAISASTNPADIGEWTDSQEQKLLDMKRRLAGAEAEDPGRRVRHLRAHGNQIALLQKTITEIHGKLSAEIADGVKTAIEELHAAEEAQGIAFKEFESLKAGLLPGFGGKAWQLLYNAARDYSLQEAYRDEEFPNIKAAARCVLCQQALSEDAKKRMHRFKDYMEQSTKKATEAAQEKLRSALDALPPEGAPLAEQHNNVLLVLGGDKPELAKNVEAYFSGMAKRAQSLRKAIEEANYGAVSPIVRSPADELGGLVKTIEEEAERVEKTAQPEILQKLRAEIEELQAKKSLAQRKVAISKYIKELQIAAKYNRCIQRTQTREITTQGKMIISEALTPQLDAALDGELQELGATHLRVDLRTSGSLGDTRHKIELQGTKPSVRANLTEILSESEQTIVGLAGFLAELKVAGKGYAIVLDDPVSSLDMQYRERIARRMAKEAQTRQVIIFTHDIAFLVALRAKATEVGQCLFVVRTVRREGALVGQVLEDVPWQAMQVKERLSCLERRLCELRKLYVSQPEDYKFQAAILYNLLRETWEVFVEEALLDGTVTRLAPSVQTKRLQGVRVEDIDYKIIDVNMTKCSSLMLGHDTPKSLTTDRPPPEEIQSDIETLRGHVKDIHIRNQQTRKVRKALSTPQEPMVG